jgi:UDP-N-acetylmuramoyl-tripeptide--D-alanyl-D-alanine ligase
MTLPTNRAAFTIREIAAATGGQVLRDGPPVTAVANAAGHVAAGAAFVAVDVEPWALARAVADAALSGAGAFVIERALACPPGRGVVVVPDARTAYAALASAHRARWSMQAPSPTERPLFALAGSTGTATTKRYVAALLEATNAGPVLRTPSRGGDLVGVASTLLALDERHRAAVVELPSARPEETAVIAAFARPDVALITSVDGGSARSAGLEDLRGGALLRAGLGLAGGNHDDRAVRVALATLASAATPVVTWGFGAAADYRIASRTPLGVEGAIIEIARPDRRPLVVRAGALGRSGALAVAAAIAVVERWTGAALPADLVEAALDRAHDGEEARLVTTPLPDDVLILEDATEASPAGVRAALETAKELSASLGRNLVVVLGALDELGPIAAAEHAEIGAAIAAANPRLLVGIGRDAGNAVAEALAAGVEAWSFDAAGAAVARSASSVRAGDVVLAIGGRRSGIAAVTRAIVASRFEPRVLPAARIAGGAFGDHGASCPVSAGEAGH